MHVEIVDQANGRAVGAGTIERRTVELEPVDAGRQLRPQPIPQPPHPRSFLGQPRDRQPGRLGQPHDPRHVERATPHAAFLTAAMHERLDPHGPLPAPDEQRPGALGAVKLVRRETGQVGAERIDVDGHAAERLRTVDVHEPAGGMHDRGERRHVLHHARLVVGQQQRDEQRVRADRRLEIGRANPPRDAGRIGLPYDGQPRHGKPLPLEVLSGVERGMVVGHGDDDPSPRRVTQVPGPGRESEQSDVRALGGPAREYDLTGHRPDRGGEGRPCRLDRIAGLAAHFVGRAAGVAVVVGEPRQHRLEHPRVESGRGVVVEVDRVGHGR